MKYKRLTKHIESMNPVDGNAELVDNSIKAYIRLIELEDKIENGTLIELPCKIGDTFYEAVKGLPLEEWEMTSISICRNERFYDLWAERKRDYAHWKFLIEDFGKTCFLTKKEAEAKLKELNKE